MDDTTAKPEPAEHQEPGQDGAEAGKSSGDATAPHPISIAIDRLIHRARDIKVAARRFLPVAYRSGKKNYEGVRAGLEGNVPLLEDKDRHVRALAQKEIHELMVRFERLRNSNVPAAVESGLFLALFSAFDAFTGDLLRGLFSRKAVLFNSLTRTLTFGEVLGATSIDELKLQVLDDDIENLRRKSYVDQFDTLTQRFGVRLTAFDDWPDFVECSQRRNLITHCDGVVTQQYINVCRAAGIKEQELQELGSRVSLGAKYFYKSCELIIEVGLKLGQTLWRKALPEELSEADRHLIGAVYNALEIRVWPRARMMAEFAFGLTSASYGIESDINKRIVTVNYAQALKRDGAPNEAKRILDQLDWTAAAGDFRLGYAVLTEDYDEAARLMTEIGEKGLLITEHAYHTWPLFIEFRETDEFARAYAGVFGHPYADRLREDADEASRAAAAEATKELASGEEPDLSHQDDRSSDGGTETCAPAESRSRTSPERSA